MAEKVVALISTIYPQMKNSRIAQIFRNIGAILEIQGENPFRIRAYERAAQNLENLTEDIEEINKAQELENIPGIGKDLAKKIEEEIGFTAYAPSNNDEFDIR